MHPDQLKLFEFCKTKIDDDTLVFDKVLDIYDEIIYFLKKNNLPLKYEKKILLMKITYFVFKNSELNV